MNSRLTENFTNSIAKIYSTNSKVKLIYVKSTT